jgi:tetratricopeptide (TPR) repeat protein
VNATSWGVYQSKLGFQIRHPGDWGVIESRADDVAFAEERVTLRVRVALKGDDTSLDHLLDRAAQFSPQGANLVNAKAGLASAKRAAGTDRNGEYVWILAAVYSDCAYIVTARSTSEDRSLVQANVTRMMSEFAITRSVSVEQFHASLLSRDLPWQADSVAKAHYEKGGALFDAGNVTAALSELSEAVRLVPGNASARVELSRVLAESKQFDRAVAEARAAVFVAPDLGRAYSVLGNAYWQRGNEAQALRAYTTALSKAPTDTLANFGAGMLLAKQTSQESRLRARRCLEDYLRLSGNLQSPADQQRRLLATSVLRTLQ